MKLVHKPLTPWISALCVVAFVLTCTATPDDSGNQPYLAYYQPDKGFKPAQTNLTDILLQLAGSLEHSGSPELYLRHMQKEHARISAKFTAKTGKPHVSRMPAYLTDGYIDKLIANWNLLSPKLKLDDLAKNAGRCAREGIRGTRDTGTIVVQMLNEHQKLVADEMAAGGEQKTGFEQLRSRLEEGLEYKKEKISMVGNDASRRDAISYALIFEGILADFNTSVAAKLPPEKAEVVKQIVESVFMDLGHIAHSEFEIGMVEWALK